MSLPILGCKLDLRAGSAGGHEPESVLFAVQVANYNGFHASSSTDRVPVTVIN